MPRGGGDKRLLCDSSTRRSEKTSRGIPDDARNSPVANIFNLPVEISERIFRFLTFQNIAEIRRVSKIFNEMGSNLLNKEFDHLRSLVQQRLRSIKAQMPRRVSTRCKHPLSRELDIIETLHRTFVDLQMTFGKHIDRQHCCFFAGEILDEVYRILQYVESRSPNLKKEHEVTNELFDLYSMVMEHFKESIEPTLPEIPNLATVLLNNTPSLSCDMSRVRDNSRLLWESLRTGSSERTPCDPPGNAGNSSTITGILNLPIEILEQIFKFLLFQNIAQIRRVCKLFNEVCSSMLNKEFDHLRSLMQQRIQSTKSQMPRRRSSRRKHPLARELDIIESIERTFIFLQMTFSKHIEKHHCCFFAGEVLDEVHRILQYVKNCSSNLNWGFQATEELNELAGMAREYFNESIKPTLPEICTLGTVYLDYSPDCFISCDGPWPGLLEDLVKNQKWGIILHDINCAISLG